MNRELSATLNGHSDPAHAPIQTVPAEQARPWYAATKRTLDWLAAGILFVGSLPVMLGAMLLVKLTSSGPALYSQMRLGRGGRTFAIYKIRTMRHDCEKASGIRWCVPGDPRITPVGWFLRKTHIDELPQLWNVLRGDMSLIGPRPERPEFFPELEAAIPCYRDRLLVRPGVSGLAQVQLPPDTDLASVRRKLACDLYYIRHTGLWLDLRLMLATAGYLLNFPLGMTLRTLTIPHGQPVETSYHQLAAHQVRVGVLELASERETLTPAVGEARHPLAAALAPACQP